MIENPDTKDRVIVIAEAGVNHNGDFDRAVEMIHAAKLAGRSEEHTSELQSPN